ncbi:MAG: restriction endonuclease [Dolichospermum sp. DEX182a]|nr:restriction endonuclease [Dolichospermum sp. DEX182a]QSV64323.1 MAG: restriction endonuclease [Dolichospermum sp. DL01]
MKKNRVSGKSSSNNSTKTLIDVTVYQDLKNIQVYGKRLHTKASESYLDVTFNYENDAKWEGSIPIEYRRTGTELSDISEIKEYLLQAYDHCQPNNRKEWLVEQEKFWRANKAKADVTKSLFDALTNFQWTCISCKFPNNPNWARRNQDLKEFGFTIATYPKKNCNQCGKKTTHLILVPLPRGGITGYEAWSPKTREKIIETLKFYDVYEGKVGKKESLLPDHKFPEIRWDENTRRSQEAINNLTDKEIINDFQLMTNQRNLQKREVCRQCFQNNIRPYPFGIKFYYQGDERWPNDISKNGKDAETGCIGCGWHDMEKWRNSLNQKLADFVDNEEN